MKKIIILPILFFCSFGFAQVETFDADYIEAFKKDVQAESRKMVNENLTLTEEEGKIFWPIYDDYTAAYDKLVDERLKVIEEYMLNYYGMDNETAKDLINKAINLKMKGVELQKEYIDKMLAVLPASVVGKFFQIDNRIAVLIDVVRMSTVPMVRNEEE